MKSAHLVVGDGINNFDKQGVNKRFVHYLNPHRRMWLWQEGCFCCVCDV